MRLHLKADMIIREALPEDFETVSVFLRKIAEQHRLGRPDIFKKDAQKYSREDFCAILTDENKPVFVTSDDSGERIFAHAFCQIREHPERTVAFGRKTLFLDDLYVDPSARGTGVGTCMMEHLKRFASEKGCYNIELNVWEFNEGAISFYNKIGMSTQTRQMELIISGEDR